MLNQTSKTNVVPTHNLKSQMDIKSTAAKTDIKTNLTQHTTPTSNGH